MADQCSDISQYPISSLSSHKYWKAHQKLVTTTSNFLLHKFVAVHHLQIVPTGMSSWQSHSLKSLTNYSTKIASYSS